MPPGPLGGDREPIGDRRGKVHTIKESQVSANIELINAAGIAEPLVISPHSAGITSKRTRFP